MSNQPPSFEPGSRRDRPDAEGAKIVRSTSEQLDEWAATGPKPARSARRSMLEQELGMEAGEASGQAQLGRLAVTVPASDTEQAVSTLRHAGIAAEVRS